MCVTELLSLNEYSKQRHLWHIHIHIHSICYKQFLAVSVTPIDLNAARHRQFFLSPPSCCCQPHLIAKPWSWYRHSPKM